MNQSLIITIDSSTTASKVIAWDIKGKLISLVSKKIRLNNPQFGYYEQNAEEWWLTTKDALKELYKNLKSYTIECISIACQRESFVAIDKFNKPIHPAILWLDERGKEIFDFVKKDTDPKKIHEITGKPIDLTPSLYKIIWLKKNKPQLFKKIHKVLDVHSYLSLRLTGKAVASWTSADPTGLFDLKKKDWSESILKLCGLNYNQLPDAVPPGRIIGELNKYASEATGIAIGTPIVSAGGDGQCAALGSGVNKNNTAYINLGTAAVAGVYSKTCRVSNYYRTMTACDSKGYLLELVIRSGTFMVDRFIDLFFSDTRLTGKEVNQLMEESSKIIPGSNGLLFVPYCNGVMSPYWNSYAGGILFGLKGSHKRQHIFRSIMEGIALEIKLWTDQIEKGKNNGIDKIVLVGGGAKSGTWTQIISDVTGKSIYKLNTSEVTSKGALLLGSIAVGWYPDLEKSIQSMNKIKLACKPNITVTGQYQRIFNVYKEIYPRNQDLFLRLHKPKN